MENIRNVERSIQVMVLIVLVQVYTERNACVGRGAAESTHQFGAQTLCGFAAFAPAVYFYCTRYSTVLVLACYAVAMLRLLLWSKDRVLSGP